jgi:hypothetical protein
MAEMVKAPVWMHAHNQASMPSRGGREGIDGTGVSRRPEANQMIASFMYDSYHRNRNKIHQNHQPRNRDDFITFLSG